MKNKTGSGFSSDNDIVLSRLSETPNQWVGDMYFKTRVMVHSRVADLRKKGYVIEAKCFGKRDWRYRLIVLGPARAAMEVAG